MKRKTVLKRISCYFLTMVLVFSAASWFSCEESAAASTVTRYKWTRITESAQLSNYYGKILMVVTDSSGQEYYWTTNYVADPSTVLKSNFGVYTPHFEVSALSSAFSSDPFDTSLPVNYTETVPSDMLSIINSVSLGDSSGKYIAAWFWTDTEVMHHNSKGTYKGSDHFRNYGTFVYSTTPGVPGSGSSYLGNVNGVARHDNKWDLWSDDQVGQVGYYMTGSGSHNCAFSFNEIYKNYFKNYSAAQMNALIKYYETGASKNTTTMANKKSCMARLRAASVNTDVDTDNYDWGWLRNATDDEMSGIATSFKNYLSACSKAGYSYKDYGTASVTFVRNSANSFNVDLHVVFDGTNLFPQQNEGANVDFSRSFQNKSKSPSNVKTTINYYSAAQFKLFGYEAVQMPCYSGEVTLASNQVIVWDNNEIVDAGSTVTVPASSTLIISSGVELNGSLNVEGKLIINAGGTLRCKSSGTVVELKDGTRASFTIMDGGAAYFYLGQACIIIGDSCTMTVKGNCYFAGRIGLAGSLIIGNAGHLVLGASLVKTVTSDWLLASHSRAEVAAKVYGTRNWNIGTILTMEKGAFLDNSQGGTISYFRTTTSQDQFRGQAFFSTTDPLRPLDE